MDDETRAKAVEKADAVKSKIGYPDWILNTDELNDFLKDVSSPRKP